MASCYFFIDMNVKNIQTNNSFDKILSLSFDLKSLKVFTYVVKQKSILQRTIKKIYIIKHILWEIN
jgi:hypothetical protein